MPRRDDSLGAQIETLRQQLQVKEAALQNRRAVLAETEARLNGRIQELTVELTHERERRRKRERELKNVLAPTAATPVRAGEDSHARPSETTEVFDAGVKASRRTRSGATRFSSLKKRRWKTR